MSSDAGYRPLSDTPIPPPAKRGDGGGGVEGCNHWDKKRRIEGTSGLLTCQQAPAATERCSSIPSGCVRNRALPCGFRGLPVIFSLRCRCETRRDPGV